MLICSLTPFNNAYRQATPLGGGHFPLAPFFILVWLTLLAAAARKIFVRRILLTGRELLVAWILMVLVSGIAYTGLARTFFINLTAPHQFATVENRWEEVLQPLLPERLYPQSAEAVQQLYNGLPGGRQMGWLEAVLRRIPWDAWIVPLLTWGGFVLLCYFVMICIVNLLSRQALDNERMNFPLLRVPELIEEALDNDRLGPSAGRPLPAARPDGSGPAASGQRAQFLLSGGAPDPDPDPGRPLLSQSRPLFRFHQTEDLHLSGLYRFRLSDLQADHLFPSGFFSLPGALLVGLLSLLGYNIPAAALGVTFGPTLSRPEETQMIGAYLVFFLFLFWLARHHFSSVLRDGLLDLPAVRIRSRNWLSTRFAFWGFVLGTLGIIDLVPLFRPAACRPPS